MQKYTKKHKHNFSRKITKRNVRANTRTKTKQAAFLLKTQKHELNQAAVVARLVANAAVDAGIVVDGAGPAEIMDIEINLPQAIHIANEVAARANNPIPIQEQIHIQAEQVQKRGRGCMFSISLRNLFHILMTLSVLYSTKYPILAPPRDTTFFETAAGYLAIGGTVGSMLSLDSAGIYTMCGIGTQIMGASTRFVSSATGVHPMSPYEKKRELLKLAEYTPSGPVAEYLQMKKLSGIGYLARESHRKKESVLSKVKELLSKPIVNINTSVGKEMGMSKNEVIDRPNIVTKKVLESFIP